MTSGRSSLRRGGSHLRANAIAYLALFVALGGTSYAAIRLPANSVGSQQIRRGAVTDSKVRARSLTARVFRAGELPVGPRGETGAQGERGEQGPPGPANLVLRQAEMPEIADGPRDERSGVAACQGSELVTGGGYHTSDPEAVGRSSGPVSGPDGKARHWQAKVRATGAVTVYVICAAP
jgi:hypothetical protein